MTMRGSGSLHNRFADDIIGSVAAIMLVDPLSAFSDRMGGVASPIAANMAALARIATAFAVPVVLSIREGQGPVCDQIMRAVPRYHVFERSGAAILAGQPTLSAIQRLRRRVMFFAAWGRGQDIIDAALEAQAAGFDVRVVLDACWVSDGPDERDVAARMVAAGIELTAWVAVVAALSQDYPTDGLPGHIRRAIAENLVGYAPTVPAFWNSDGRLDRAEAT